MISAGAGRGASESRDQHTSLQRLSSQVLFLRSLRQWYWTSALRALVIESRNLSHRIRWALEIRAWALRGYRAPLPTVWGSAPVRPYQAIDAPTLVTCEHHRMVTLFFPPRICLWREKVGRTDGRVVPARALRKVNHNRVHRLAPWTAILCCPQ
jgi:hypothetical protein